jgi:hypothetical protein
MMRRADLSEFDDKGNPTIWTTPHELTKTKATAKPRSYLTPLPLLAQRQIKGLPASDGGDGLMFPGLSVHHTKRGARCCLPIVCARDLFDTVHQGLQLPRRASHDRDVVAEQGSIGLRDRVDLEPCGHRRHRRIWPWLSAQTQTRDADGMGRPRRTPGWA